MKLFRMFAVSLLLVCANGAIGGTLMNIETDLAEQLAAGSGGAREFSVIVTLQRAEDVSVLVAQGVRPANVFGSIPGFAATLTAAQIKSIAKLPQVKFIELDREARAIGPR